MTEYERMLLHRALWIWCAETGQWKKVWPGWDDVDEKIVQDHCFLCGNESCDECRSKLGAIADIDCLQGFFHDAVKFNDKLKLHDSWINRRAYALACYRIAFVEWKIKPTQNINSYFDTRNKLQKVYGDHPVHFVPVGSKDYNRFVTSYWRAR